MQEPDMSHEMVNFAVDHKWVHFNEREDVLFGDAEADAMYIAERLFKAYRWDGKSTIYIDNPTTVRRRFYYCGIEAITEGVDYTFDSGVTYYLTFTTPDNSDPTLLFYGLTEAEFDSLPSLPYGVKVHRIQKGEDKNNNAYAKWLSELPYATIMATRLRESIRDRVANWLQAFPQTSGWADQGACFA